MAINIMNLVWNSDLHQTQKMVMLALADAANSDGFCWPSQRNIAKKCSMSERHVRRVISNLAEVGFLTKNRNPRRGLSYQINVEVLQSDRTHSPIEYDLHRTHSPVTPATGGRCIEPSRTVINTPSKKQTAIPVKKSKTPSPHAWFSRWWSFSYEELTGSRYAYTKKSAGMIKNLISQLPIDELVQRSCVFFTMPDSQRFPRGAPTLEGLANAINQLGGRCSTETEDRCFAAGMLPDYGVNILDHQPWKNDNQPLLASAEN